MRGKLKAFLEKPQLVFLILGGIFGIFSVFLMPILEAPDENLHFQISYAIFSSNKHAPASAVLSEGIVLSSIRNHRYAHYFDKDSAVAHDGYGINTGSEVFDGKTRASIFDLMHIPQAIGIAMGRLIYPSVGVMVITGRLVNLICYLGGLYFIIKFVRYGKWVYVAIATLPILVQQSASLSYDPINILAIFAWTAFVINLYVDEAKLKRSQIVLAIVLGIFLLLTKANNILLLILLLALPKHYITDTRMYQRLRNTSGWQVIKYGCIFIFVLLSLGAIAVIGKHLLVGNPLHPYRLLHVLMNTFIWGNGGDLSLIDATVTGMVGEFSNFYYHLPVWTIVYTFVVLSLVMLSEKLPHISKRFALVSGGLFFGSILVISIGMYYSWAMLPIRLGPNAQVTDGIQGRYFTPLLILLFPVFAYIQKHLSVMTRKITSIPLLVSCSSSLLFLYYLLETWHFFWR